MIILCVQKVFLKIFKFNQVVEMTQVPQDGFHRLVISNLLHNLRHTHLGVDQQYLGVLHQHYLGVLH